jgi:hypothetical protein
VIISFTSSLLYILLVYGNELGSYLDFEVKFQSLRMWIQSWHILQVECHCESCDQAISALRGDYIWLHCAFHFAPISQSDAQLSMSVLPIIHVLPLSATTETSTDFSASSLGFTSFFVVKTLTNSEESGA